MAIYPWIVLYERQQQDLADFPNIRRWFDAIAARPATVRGLCYRGDAVKCVEMPGIIGRV
jgi:GST-like protein